jgi:hypothetical protein
VPNVVNVIAATSHPLDDNSFTEAIVELVLQQATNEIITPFDELFKYLVMPGVFFLTIISHMLHIMNSVLGFRVNHIDRFQLCCR